jgi:hypothetical protein
MKSINAFWMRRIFLFSGLIVLLLSCSEQPHGVMSEQKMANVIYDMTLANNCMMTRGYISPKDSLKQKNFEYVLHKYHVTVAEFDTSAIWYAHNSTNYEEVYGLVITKLQALQKDLNAGKYKDKVIVRTKNDTIDLWHLPRDYPFKNTLPVKNALLVNKEQPRNKVAFRVDGSLLGKGDKLLMTFLLKIDPSDHATHQHMWIKVHYFPNITDSLFSYTKNDGKWRKYKLSFPLSTTRKVNFVEGVLLDFTKAKGKDSAVIDSIHFVNVSYPPPPVPKKKVKHKPWYKFL